MGSVVLCYPMAHEYVYVHRAYLQLAIRLSRAGFHALRFDYYGFGDSYGESDDGHFEEWITDICNAIDELKSLSDGNRISLVGFRLGATAAALAASQRNDVENLILWEPVIDGSKYVEELLDHHRHWVSENLSHASYNENSEIIGIPFTRLMKATLEKTNLRTINRSLCKKLLVIENGEREIDKTMLGILENMSENFDRAQFTAPYGWDGTGGMNAHYIPNDTINFIISWLLKVSK